MAPPLVIQQTFDGVSSEPMSALSLGPCLFAFCCPTMRFRWFDVGSLRMLSFTSNGCGAHGQFLWAGGRGRARLGESPGRAGGRAEHLMVQEPDEPAEFCVSAALFLGLPLPLSVLRA